MQHFFPMFCFSVFLVLSLTKLFGVLVDLFDCCLEFVCFFFTECFGCFDAQGSLAEGFLEGFHQRHTYGASRVKGSKIYLRPPLQWSFPCFRLLRNTAGEGLVPVACFQGRHRRKKEQRKRRSRKRQGSDLRVAALQAVCLVFVKA